MFSEHFENQVRNVLKRRKSFNKFKKKRSLIVLINHIKLIRKTKSGEVNQKIILIIIVLHNTPPSVYRPHLYFLIFSLIYIFSRHFQSGFLNHSLGNIA